MFMFHVCFIPLLVSVLIKLLWDRHLKDAVIFFILSLAGYLLWLGIIKNHPIIITVYIAKIIETLKVWED